MKLKALSQAVMAATLVSGAAVAQAEEESGFQIAGNVALTTDYRFRGITQTDGGPAIQGGFDIEHESGLYAGIWGSNIDFGQGSIELDYYAGFAGDITEDVSFDLGYIWYDYPQGDGTAGGVSQNLDYAEVYASISVAGVTLGAVHSPDYTGNADEFRYYYVDYSVGLPEDVSLDLHYGFNEFDDTADFQGFTGSPDNDAHYADWSVGVSKDAFGVNWGLSYVDTDIDSSVCDGVCDSAFIFTLSKSL